MTNTWSPEIGDRVKISLPRTEMAAYGVVTSVLDPFYEKHGIKDLETGTIGGPHEESDPDHWIVHFDIKRTIQAMVFHVSRLEWIDPPVPTPEPKVTEADVNPPYQVVQPWP